MYEGCTPLRRDGSSPLRADDVETMTGPPPPSMIGGNPGPAPSELTVTVTGESGAGKSTLLLMLADLLARLDVPYVPGRNVPFTAEHLRLTPLKFAYPVTVKLEEITPEEVQKDRLAFFETETCRRAKVRAADLDVILADEGTRATPPTGSPYQPSSWVGMSEALADYQSPAYAMGKLTPDTTDDRSAADCKQRFPDNGLVPPPFPYFNQLPAREIGEPDTATTDIYVTQAGETIAMQQPRFSAAEAVRLSETAVTWDRDQIADLLSGDSIRTREIKPADPKRDMAPTRVAREIEPAKPEVTIAVYIDDGRVFEYAVATPDKAREHTSAIIATGYRHCVPGELEHYPPHRIAKVKVSGQGVSTGYPDKVRGT